MGVLILNAYSLYEKTENDENRESDTPKIGYNGITKRFTKTH